jgi:hypothetical protein
VTWRALLALGLALLPARLQGQNPAQDLASGIRAYQELEFDQAAGLLRRAAASVDAMDAVDAARALAYLGATEIFRERPDSARAAFGRLVRFDPRYRIDALVFPPEVTGVFESVRRTVRAIAVALPATASFRAGQPGLVLDLFPSVLHTIRVEILRADGAVARALYAGLLGDSLRVEWDGRGAAGAPLASGRYVLAFTSLDETRTPLRIVRVPLTVSLTLGDTTPHPLPPADSAFLPEREASGPALRALIGGVAAGLAVSVVPALVASDARLSPTRFLVGASVSIAGLSTFFTLRPGRPIAANVSANERRRADWRAAVDSAARHNEELKRVATLFVQLGPRQVVEREGS